MHYAHTVLKYFKFTLFMLISGFSYNIKIPLLMKGTEQLLLLYIYI